MMPSVPGSCWKALAPGWWARRWSTWQPMRSCGSTWQLAEMYWIPSAQVQVRECWLLRSAADSCQRGELRVWVRRGKSAAPLPPRGRSSCRLCSTRSCLRPTSVWAMSVFCGTKTSEPQRDVPHTSCGAMHRPQFDQYQATRNIGNRNKLKAAYWASFVGTPSDETLFVGLYGVKYRGLLAQDTPMPHTDGVDKADSCDVYDLMLEHALGVPGRQTAARLGSRRSCPGSSGADRQNKPITELRTLSSRSPDFPGFLNFMEPLSRLDKLPKGWIDVLHF